MIDGDDGWESIVNYKDVLDYSRSNFKVFDENGNELLAESGIAMYGFDGKNTYVVVMTGVLPLGIKSWQFRTDVLDQNSKSLAKTKSIHQAQMQIYGLSDGNYKVSLIPSSGNQVQFQMFDLMGRCIFSKQLENLKTPVTFTIPESNIPNSPFIAKVKDGNETLYKKQIPVR